MHGRLLIAMTGLLLAGCRGEHASDAPKAVTGERIHTESTVRLLADGNAADGPAADGPVADGPAADGLAANGRTSASGAAADTLRIEPSASEVAWAGTKMWGRGGHTGVVPIESGWIATNNGRLTGGYIVVDMTSIGITDIPPDQPEPIELLTSHLEDPLFLHVEKYPRASFRLIGSERAESGLLIVDGLLTIRGITRSIRIPVEIERAGALYHSRFRIDRFDWNVAYEGGFGATRFAARNFVDREIELDIRLEVNR